jgi:DNA-binding NarL/FixJ family response regulator
LLAEALAASVAGTPTASQELLSAREFQVLCLVAKGKTLKEIGTQLFLSEKTVATYRARIAKKMRLGTNVELARYAMRHKLVD